MRNTIEMNTAQFIPDISAYNNTDKKIDFATETSLLRKPRKEKVGSDAFNLEYDSPPTRAEMRRDIVSYLGEYRLQVQKYDYDLVYGRDKDHRGEITLRDIDRGPSLHYMSRKTLESRRIENKPTHREEAEKKGLEYLNDQLRLSKEGDTVVWVSPPGPKEQGYGDYGFVYKGTVHMLDNGERHVPMTAIRIENPKPLEGGNGEIDPWIARSQQFVNEINQQHKIYQTAEDFLSQPQVSSRQITDQKLDQLLQENFHFIPQAQDQEQMQSIIKEMDPLIEEYLSLMESGTKREKLQAFYVLENYALALKEKRRESKEEITVYESTALSHATLRSLSRKYSYRPPAVSGSCGSSEGGLLQSNNISFFGGSQGEKVMGSTNEDQFGSLDFECPKGHSNTRPRGKLIPNCTTCGVSVSC